MKVNQQHTSRKWPLKLFRLFCHPDFAEDIEGDLLERYELREQTKGTGFANRQLIIDVLQLFRPGIIRKLEGNYRLNHYGMFRNYVLTALRNMKKERLFTFMNVAGLSLSIGCALVIYSVITYERSFDTHHKHYDHIYRVINKQEHAGVTEYGEGQVHPIASALMRDFPGLKAVVTYYQKQGQVSIKDKSGTLKGFLETDGIVFTEPELFDIFDFNLIAGHAATSLSEPKSVVISSQLAQKYFSLKKSQVHQAIGQQLILENTETLQVTGVMEDPPRNTDLPFRMLIHYQSIPVVYRHFDENAWDDFSGLRHCYVKLPEGTNAEGFDEELEPFFDRYKNNKALDNVSFLVQPLSEMHSSDITTTYNAHAPITSNMLFALAVIGVFLIITAAINFINLSTAQASHRSKEIGVRKVLGGSRYQLALQFLSETTVIAYMAALIGIGVAEITFEYLVDIVGYRLSVTDFTDSTPWLFLCSLMITIVLLSGAYPAYFMARMEPVNALRKNNLEQAGKGFLSMRRALVVFQFTISQVLIIGTIVVTLQIDYFRTADLGVNKESILICDLPKFDNDQLDLLKQKLKRHASIKRVSYSYRAPHGNWSINNPIFHESIHDHEHYASLKPADADYMDLFQLNIIAGRKFDENDVYNNVVVNRRLTKDLGFDHPDQALGEGFSYAGWMDLKIVGVVEDFHSRSLHEPMESMVFAQLNKSYQTVSIQFATGRTLSELQGTIDLVAQEWNTIFPEDVFDYQFYDKKIAALYSQERKIARLVQLFAAIAIFIGCLGLYGLITYLTNCKTKEIGIRKVLGASLGNILKIFSGEMLVLILGALLIAGPLGYWMMNEWLQNFSYRIELSPYIFVGAGIANLIISLLTIGHKSLTAALANPVMSLKDE